ncbi:MAG: response regulator [Acidimicrobiales bacterium]
MKVVAYVPDLMDRSKVAAAVPDAVFVRRPSDLIESAAVGTTVVVDLSRPGVLDVLGFLADAGARVVGFGSHVDADLLASARDAGCAVVLARSAFFRGVADAVGYSGAGS